jgi:hypothetical protein
MNEMKNPPGPSRAQKNHSLKPRAVDRQTSVLLLLAAASMAFGCGNSDSDSGGCDGILVGRNCVDTVTNCTDPLALNFNDAATEDDGTCEYTGTQLEPNDTINAGFQECNAPRTNCDFSGVAIGDNDNLANRFLDVDFYRVQIFPNETVTVELFAKRLSTSSRLDTVLTAFGDNTGFLIEDDDGPPGSLSTDSLLTIDTGANPADDFIFFGVSTFCNSDYNALVEGSGSLTDDADCVVEKDIPLGRYEVRVTVSEN